MTPAWTLHPDGSFDLVFGALALRHAFPAFERTAVRPRTVEVAPSQTGGTVAYTFAEGRILVSLGVDADGAWLDSRLEGFARAPHWFHPLANATIEGAARLFRTGVGFSGPTGFVDLAGDGGLQSWDSYLVTALVDAAGATLATGALRHADFLHKCAVWNRVDRANFRNREVASARFHLESGFSTERIALAGTLELPRLVFRGAPCAWDALRSVALGIGRASKARVGPPSYHWCSWYERGSHFTLEDLVRFLDGARGLGEPLAAVQIDDGYCTFEGDWLEENEKWPGGLPRAFAEIRARGYRPGIWIAPYMVESRSRLFREHPDWMLRGLDGKPIAAWERWDGSHRSEEFHILDTSHPEAFAHLRHVFRTLRSWGAGMYKTDFVEWGFKDSTTVLRHTPGKTSAQYHHDVIRMIREEIGPDSHWLGCIAYFAPYVGYVDSMRMTSDTGPEWHDAQPGPDGSGGGMANVIHETYATLFLNNALFQNDPDALFLRDWRMRMKPGEIEAIAVFCATLGVSINTSDRLQDLPAERLRLWRFLRPQQEPWTADLPRFGREAHLMTAVRPLERTGAHACCVLNPSASPQTAAYTLRELCGRDSAHVFRWGPAGAEALGPRSELVVTLPRHGGVLYYLSQDGSPPPAGLTPGGHLPG